MSMFQDPYLANSAGFSQGYAEALVRGRDEGYRLGWDAAVKEASVIIHRANNNIDELNAEVAQLKRLVAASELLIHTMKAAKQQDGKHHQEELADADVEINELEQKLQLHQEQAQTLRMQYEDMFKAFLGVVAIARPAMKVVAKLPYDERAIVFKGVFSEAVALQSKEYLIKNKYPSDQPLIAKYLPISTEVFNRTFEQMEQQKAEAKQSRKPEPA